ncbi:capsid protein [Giardia-associated CRESS DNA virus 2]|uniref:Capsid protein n=1 Tax=Giardia-associated CRESS DNA virus 2 TaxID=2766566 RepID=A0AAE7JE56_9VIRU|nr:capsid protein [Giardia-associated CRESS DNA virus 2]QNJ47551.1 capsid protein [Giardia-associated CRESS DNA virus 2]
MAWSYRTRRTFTRSARRSFRRRSVARPRYSRRRWGTRRAAKKTVSSVVTLSQDAVWSLFNTMGESTLDTRQWYPFAFTPANVPGFSEYKATYSHFRILKAKLYISRNVLKGEGTTNNYLIVGSRPFAAVTYTGSTAASPYVYVPPQREYDLRQSKWQKICYPSTVRNVITTSFHPYTMIESFGPLTTGPTGNLWSRIWEARRWMPFSWVLGPYSGVDGNGITFYGPYMVIDTSTGELPQPGAKTDVGVECTLRISVQFKGQK